MVGASQRIAGGGYRVWPLYIKSARKPVGLSFRLKGLRTSARFPLFKHTAFYFPPSANKDRAVNSIEIKDFIILWTYSQ